MLYFRLFIYIFLYFFIEIFNNYLLGMEIKIIEIEYYFFFDYLDIVYVKMLGKIVFGFLCVGYMYVEG